MAKRRKHTAEPPALEALRQPPPDDQGISLDELSQAYASLLDQGEDPYTEAPDDEAALGLPAAEREEDDSEPQEDQQPEPDHDRVAPITPRSILEAMLFIGHPDNEPLTSDKVASLMRGVRPQEIDGLVVELNRSYQQEGCPYKIESEGPGYRLVLRDEFHSLRDKFYGRLKAARLSQAAIDVLAIVAYKQPTSREDVDELRGRSSGAILTQLVRRGLLRVERPPEHPRTPRYSTTDRFLELFGLGSLSDLPKSPDGGLY